MSFRVNSCLAAEIPCYAAAIPRFRRNGNMSNVLIYHVIKPRRPPETGKSGAIFEDSLLNSLLYWLGCTPVVRQEKW
jgi:hypothetical protein